MLDDGAGRTQDSLEYGGARKETLALRPMLTHSSKGVDVGALKQRGRLIVIVIEFCYFGEGFDSHDTSIPGVS